MNRKSSRQSSRDNVANLANTVNAKAVVLSKKGTGYLKANLIGNNLKNLP